MNNLPPLFGQQDQLTTCRDLLEVARNGKVIGPKFGVNSKYSYVPRQQGKTRAVWMEELREQMLKSMRRLIPWADQFPSDAKVGTTLRIRVPADYKVTDGPGYDLCATPEHSRCVHCRSNRC